MKLDEARKRFPRVVDLAGAEPVRVTDDQGRTVAVVVSAKQFKRLSARPEPLEWAQSHRQRYPPSLPVARQVVGEHVKEWAAEHLETAPQPPDDSVAARRLAVEMADLLRLLGLTQEQACSAAGIAAGVSRVTVADWARRADKGWDFKLERERRRPTDTSGKRPHRPKRVPEFVRAEAAGRVIKLSEPVSSVARAYGVTPRSVRRWVDRALEAVDAKACEACAQRDRGRSGRPRKQGAPEHPSLFPERETPSD